MWQKHLLFVRLSNTHLSFAVTKQIKFGSENINDINLFRCDSLQKRQIQNRSALQNIKDRIRIPNIDLARIIGKILQNLVRGLDLGPH